MRNISRRAVIAAGLGVTATGAAAGAFGLVEAGVLPGKYRLAGVLGACGSPPPPPRGPAPAWQETAFWSAYRRRMVRMVTLVPAAAASARGLRVVVALHGLGGDAAATAGHLRPAMTAAAARSFAVITVDGGNTYWHRREDGDDPLAMIIHEVLPRAAARGLRTERIGIVGNSMGGYGALLLAERLGSAPPSSGSAPPSPSAPPSTGSAPPPPGSAPPSTGSGPGQGPVPRASAPAAAAVVASSPAIFASYADARAADPGAFDGQADFARNNVFSGLSALRRVPAWIDCGSDDPFAPMTLQLRARLERLAGHPAQGGIEPGCHDNAFWARELPTELQFLGRQLE
jgi:S-formylglutathione hydrolase FrmB